MKPLVSSLAVFSLLFVVVCAWSLPTFSEERNNAENKLGDFSTSEVDHGGVSLSEISESFRDKIILLEIDRSSAIESRRNSAVVKDAQILSIGNRYFIQGTGCAPKDIDTWYNDTLVGVSWESVTRYYIMTSEQFEKFAEQYSQGPSRQSNHDYE